MFQDKNEFGSQRVSEFIDELLEELGSTPDLGEINEIRKIFRKKVPLHLRAYIAAALIQKSVSTPGLGTKSWKKKGKAAGTGNSAGFKADSGNSAAKDRRYRGEAIVLFVNAGRRQRFFARMVLNLLGDGSGVGEEKIGNIRIMDNYSFIEIAPDAEERALAILNASEHKGRPIVANRAKKRGEEE